MAKRKGSQNERENSKEWSLWYSEGKADDWIWRSSGSGGRATNRARSGKSTAASYGDLTPLDPRVEPLFRVCTIELKRGYSKDLDVLSLLDGKGSKYVILNFWQQVVRDCERAKDDGWGENPILIIHRDYKMPLMVVRKEFYRELREVHGDFALVRFVLYLDMEKLVMFRLQDFFNNVSPEFFENKYKKEKK